MKKDLEEIEMQNDFNRKMFEETKREIDSKTRERDLLNNNNVTAEEKAIQAKHLMH